MTRPAAPLRVECRGPIATGHVRGLRKQDYAAAIPSTCFDARDRNVRRDHFSFSQSVFVTGIQADARAN
jgi:hypothetical protein